MNNILLHMEAWGYVFYSFVFVLWDLSNSYMTVNKTNLFFTISGWQEMRICSFSLLYRKHTITKSYWILRFGLCLVSLEGFSIYFIANKFPLTYFVLAVNQKKQDNTGCQDTCLKALFQEFGRCLLTFFFFSLVSYFPKDCVEMQEQLLGLHSPCLLSDLLNDSC